MTEPSLEVSGVPFEIGRSVWPASCTGTLSQVLQEKHEVIGGQHHVVFNASVSACQVNGSRSPTCRQ
jgi:hypothetical protein